MESGPVKEPVRSHMVDYLGLTGTLGDLSLPNVLFRYVVGSGIRSEKFTSVDTCVRRFRSTISSP